MKRLLKPLLLVPVLAISISLVVIFSTTGYKRVEESIQLIKNKK